MILDAGGLKFHLSAVWNSCQFSLSPFVDGAGAIGKVYAGDDVEIWGLITCGCNGEKIAVVANGDVVKTVSQCDCFKGTFGGWSVISHNGTGVVQLFPAGW